MDKLTQAGQAVTRPGSNCLPFLRGPTHVYALALRLQTLRF